MKNIKSRSKSSLFLMELIIVIMFFSLSSAICMKVFANAKVKTEYTRVLSGASFTAESIAETYKEYDGNLKDVSEKYNGSLSDNGILTLYFDKEWQVSSKSDAAFIVTITEDTAKSLNKAIIEVDDISGENIYDIVVAAVTD